MYRKLIFLISIVLVLGLGASQVSADVITGVVKTGGSPPYEPEIVPGPSPGGLQEGVLVYVDRVFTYTNIPGDLLGADYIKTSNDDMDFMPFSYSVTTSQSALIYVFQEPGGENDSAWMSDGADPDFITTGDTIETDKTFNVWVTDKVLPAGTYEFGDFGGVDHSNYGIAALSAGPTDPNFAYPIHPSDGAIGVDKDADLNWSAGANAGDVDGHAVYFGTTSPPPFINYQSGTSYDPGTLDFDETYYWRITEVNELHPSSPWESSVWSFTVASIECSVSVEGDFNGDCVVNFEDFMLFANEWRDSGMFPGGNL